MGKIGNLLLILFWFSLLYIQPAKLKFTASSRVPPSRVPRVLPVFLNCQLQLQAPHSHHYHLPRYSYFTTIIKLLYSILIIHGYKYDKYINIIVKKKKFYWKRIRI